MNLHLMWQGIAEAALNYIVVSTITAQNQKQTVTDLKTDLRTTKEDLLNELKDSRQNIDAQIADLKLILDDLKQDVKSNRM